MQSNKFFESSIARTKITSAKVKSKELFIGYFLGPFLALLSNAIFGAYLNRYYSDVIGWTDTTRFGIFSAVIPVTSVIFVILGNLLVGRLIDRTRTSQGKARPYMLLSAPLLVIAISFLFLTPTSLSPMVQMIWIGVSYNLYYAVAFPFFYTAHSSMVGLSTRNSDDRGKLATFSNASGVAAIGIGGSILVPIFLQGFLFVSHNGVIDRVASYNNWRIMMIALCVVTFLAILLEYFFTRERITEENVKLAITEEKISMKKQIAGCISNTYWWLIIAYFLLFQFGGMVKNGSMSYYSRWMFDSVTDEGSAGVAMGALGLIGGIPTAVGMLLAWPIAHKLGKRNAVLIGMIISVIGGLVSFIDVNSIVVVSAGLILKGIGSIPAMYVTLAILSDVLDHLEAKNGFRSDGFTMSVYGAIMVGLMGLGSGVINALLTASGYDPTAAVQSDSVQGVLAFAFLGFELICYAGIILLMLFLNVEKYVEADQKKIVESQKERVLSSGGEWIDPEERLRLEEEEAEREAETLKEKKKSSKNKKN
ncbi:MFS transporter [Radiobacillus sp. PE A8.2]|uniref:MFS transporter n=1 Tax=Radiobacillus sp. PE A8.2 TaxID=3380349 RepID=UPI00388D7F05